MIQFTKHSAKLISYFLQGDITVLVYRISGVGIILRTIISFRRLKVEERRDARGEGEGRAKYSRFRASGTDGGFRKKGGMPVARSDFPGKLSRRRGTRPRMKKLFGKGYITDTRLLPLLARRRRCKNPRNSANAAAAELGWA